MRTLALHVRAVQATASPVSTRKHVPSALLIIISATIDVKPVSLISAVAAMDLQ